MENQDHTAQQSALADNAGAPQLPTGFGGDNFKAAETWGQVHTSLMSDHDAGMLLA
jgi:hypothetical protein